MLIDGYFWFEKNFFSSSPLKVDLHKENYKMLEFVVGK